MKWIHVRDELPAITDIVLTYWNSTKMQVLLYCGRNGRAWLGPEGEVTSVYMNTIPKLSECITHWMPLPEEPNLEDKEKFND